MESKKLGRKFRLSEEEEALLKAQLRPYKSIKKLAQEFGITPRTVYNYMKKFNRNQKNDL